MKSQRSCERQVSNTCGRQIQPLHRPGTEHPPVNVYPDPFAKKQLSAVSPKCSPHTDRPVNANSSDSQTICRSLLSYNHLISKITIKGMLPIQNTHVRVTIMQIQDIHHQFPKPPKALASGTCGPVPFWKSLAKSSQPSQLASPSRAFISRSNNAFSSINQGI